RRRGALRAPEGRGARRRAAAGRRHGGAGAALGARPGRADVGDLGRPAGGRQGRDGEALPAALHALVRRAAVGRPARVQQRRAQAARRSRRAGRAAREARGSDREGTVRIAVCRPQVPFVYGGAEVMADTLAEELRARGHQAEVVTVPYKWYPGTRVLDQAFLWRLLDLEEADGRPIDRVIATKFPAYCVRHPNKVAWIAHQFRQAYDYDRSPEFGQFSESPQDRATRLAVERLDRVALAEARRVFAISQNVVDRLKRYTDVDATYLPPPPQKLAYRTAEPEPFVLSVNRLDRAKRIDLLIEAAKLDSSLRIVIAGDGPDRGRLEQLASPLNRQ